MCLIMCLDIMCSGVYPSCFSQLTPLSHYSRLLILLRMRPQNVLRSLRLLQHSYARSCLGTAPGRRYLQTHPLVPDFAFAFE